MPVQAHHAYSATATVQAMVYHTSVTVLGQRMETTVIKVSFAATFLLEVLY